MALGPLYASRPAVFLPTHAFVRRPAEWLRAISRHRATVSFAPNFAYDLCVRRVKDVGSGGRGLVVLARGGLRRRADSRADALGVCRSIPRRWVSRDELSARVRPRRTRRGRDVCAARPAAPHRRRAGQLRRAAARPSSADCRTTTAPICPNAKSARYMLSGTVRDAGLLRERSRDSGPGPDDGWLRTGDLGYLADGELYVCGRVKDLIIANGRKIHPQDLEWGVDELPGIRRGRTVAFGVRRRRRPRSSRDDCRANRHGGRRAARRRRPPARRRSLRPVRRRRRDCAGRDGRAHVERKGAARADSGASTSAASSAGGGPNPIPDRSPSSNAMLRVVTSTSAAVRLDAARPVSRDVSASTEVVVVGATRGAADDFVRASRAAPAATFGLTRFGLTELAARVGRLGLVRRASRTGHPGGRRGGGRARGVRRGDGRGTRVLHAGREDAGVSEGARPDDSRAAAGRRRAGPSRPAPTRRPATSAGCSRVSRPSSIASAWTIARRCSAGRRAAVREGRVRWAACRSFCWTCRSTRHRTQDSSRRCRPRAGRSSPRCPTATT